MRYLFLDDERMPKDVTWVLIGGVGHWGADWEIVRSCKEARDWVYNNGFPDVVSFDHDLGPSHYSGNYSDNTTGYDFVKWLVQYDMDTNLMPDDFSFTVHSMNPTGARNIQLYLDNYIQQKK